MIALTIGIVGHEWIFYILSADMPKYLKDVLELPISEIGLYSSLPYLVMWIMSILSGFFSDFLIVRKIVSITNARKIFSTLGNCIFISIVGENTTIDFCFFLYHHSRVI